MSTGGRAPRRGFTTLELLIAIGIGTTVLGCLMALWNLGAKMHKASQSTIALQAALTMTEALFGDLRQLGLEPGSPQLLIGPNGRAPSAPGTSLSFFKVVFRPDRIGLTPVRYSTTPSPGGNKYLVREESKNGRVERMIFKACPIESAEFDTHKDFWGNEYIRAAVRVLEDDRAPGTVTFSPDRSVRQQVLVRLPVPDRFGDPALSKASVIVKDAELLAP